MNKIQVRILADDNPHIKALKVFGKRVYPNTY